MITTPESAFYKTITGIIKFCFVFCLGFYALSIFALQKDAFAANVFVCGSILFTLLVLLLACFTKLIKTDRMALLFIFFFSLLFFSVWNFFYDIRPLSDYRVLLDGANSIVNGTFHKEAADKTGYFCYYNFQIGYAYYLSLFVRLFNNSLVMLKVVEIFTLSLTNVVLYKTLRIFSDIPDSFFGAMLFLQYPYIFMGSGVINNQHITLLLEALAIYFFLRLTGLKKYVICGLLISVAEVLRPTAMIILLAFFIVSLLKGIFQKNRTELLGAVILIAVYWGVLNGVNAAAIAAGIAPYGLKVSNPYFKFVLGLTGSGVTGHLIRGHSYFYSDLQYFGFDYDKYKDVAQNYLVNIIENRKIDLNWLSQKVANFAGGVDNQYVFGDKNVNSAHPFIIGCILFYGTVVYFFSVLISFIRALREKIDLNRHCFLTACGAFTLYFCVYILLEAQTRYRYEQYYLLFLMAAPYAYRAVSWVTGHILRTENNTNNNSAVENAEQ